MDEEAHLVDSILTEIRTFAALERHQEERLASRAGESRAAWRVLLAAGAEGATVPRIARRLGLSRQSVQRVADRLSESGLARYEPNPEHARSPRLARTADGSTLVATLERGARDARAGLGEGLEREELETALYVLRALRERL